MSSDPLAIDASHTNASDAAAAVILAQKAGIVDPATIAIIINLVLQYGPIALGFISKLFHHNPAPSA